MVSEASVASEVEPPTGPNGPAGALVPLSIDTALRMQLFGLFQPVVLSPDNGHLAYTACDPQRATRSKIGGLDDQKTNPFGIGCDVVVRDVVHLETTNLTRHHGNSWAPAWSPQGDRLAYLSDRSGRARLYVSDLNGHESDLGVSGAYIVPRWLDRGRILVTIPLPSKTVGEPSVTAFRAPASTPGSSAIVYRSKANLRPDELKIVGAGSDSPSWSGPHPESIIVIDVATKRRNVIVRSTETAPAHLWPSPDGSRLAYVTWRGFVQANSQQQRWNIVVADLKTSTKTTVATDVPQFVGNNVGWSPNGDYLAWFTSGADATGEMYLWDSHTRQTRLAVPAAHASFDTGGSAAADSAPAWSDNRHIVVFAFNAPRSAQYEQYNKENELWSVDVESGSARKLSSLPGVHLTHILAKVGSRDVRTSVGSVVVTGDNLQLPERVFDAVDPQTGAVRQLLTGQFNVTAPALAADGKSAIFVREQADAPQDAWRLSTDGSNATRITALNPAFDTVQFGKARMLSYLGPRGEALHSALMLPTSWVEGRRVPVIVYPYGSANKSRSINNFGFGEAPYPTEDLQVFATRGYAVLLPDVPVRTGTPMKDIADGVLAGVDAAIAQGYVDPERMGVMGHSYGGYTVFSLIAQTNRFHAAIARAGFSDWVSIYSEMRPDGTAYGITQAEANPYGLGGDPWHVRDKFIDNSPFDFFDRVETPVLIIHGSIDNAVDVFNAQMSFVALRRLGKDVELAQYQNESHVEFGWRFANQLDYEHRIVDWFERYLCPDRISPVSCR